MRTFAVVLAFIACAGHGRRVQTRSEQLQDASDGDRRISEALVMFLLACADPIVGWQAAQAGYPPALQKSRRDFVGVQPQILFRHKSGVPMAVDAASKTEAKAPADARWTGSTSVSLDVPQVPAEMLYNEYGDLSRMTEWSPLLDSVTVAADNPSHSVWVMRVPGPLKVAANLLGYPSVLSWEADLDAPGLPHMSWTSTLDADGKLKGIPNAGFEPAGSMSVVENGPGVSTMTLTLKYTLPITAPRWQIALVKSEPVQFVLRSRLKAGMKRFAKAMRREWQASRPH
mmetsp:Transcript_13343/g.25177  ORF Transcript_13343/g.25177 Transcript_13343/m.25177 type:complete len:286 (-) Transcript_13343:18-875(-)